MTGITGIYRITGTALNAQSRALDMIAQARRHGVFITEDAQLLAQLSQLQVDQEIPQELYTAVAVVLSWVYWLRGMRPGDEKTMPPFEPSEAE